MGATVELGATDAAAALGEARERTLALVARISDADLDRVHSTLMSPLVWDLGHIAAFEDLWIVHRHGHRPLLREDLAEIYDAFETPRAGRGDLDFLHPGEAREYLAAVRAQALEVLACDGVGDGAIPELVLRHEHQHNETMLQTMQLAGLHPFDPAADVAPAAIGRNGATRTNGANRTNGYRRSLTGLETVHIAAGPCAIGAVDGGFAYDNERPRHHVELPAFEIGRTPVTNGAFRRWIEDGGYARRELWSDAGWAWRTETGIDRPGGWSADLQRERRLGDDVPLDPARPVVHVCFHEAEAFARAHAARLPTELEWEKAAVWDPRTGRSLASPWGDGSPVPGVHANLDQLAGGTVATGSLPGSASPCGAEQMIGDVWEWTSSRFDGYPGFRAYPYREYSEVFFGDGYRVLRGGSWATRARVATAAFRNWDLPERRQIFSGVRIARDA